MKEHEHIPVAVVDSQNRVIEVYCQECTKDMTKEEHKKYFQNKSLYNSPKLNYKDKADPNDVASYLIP